MKRHITDKSRTTDAASRLREYLRIGRANLPHRSSLMLQRRSHDVVDLSRFVTIARGRTA